jgi:hypothetical protein
MTMLQNRMSLFALSWLISCGAPDTKIVALTPDIVVAPGELEFGDIVKLYTVRSEVQILNAGRAPLEVHDLELEIAGGYDDVFTIESEAIDPNDIFTTIEGGESLPVTLGFRPHKYMDYRARLLVHSDDEDQPVLAIPITGTGVVGATPDIAVSSLSLDFGTVPKNDTETAFFTISNEGDGPLDILGLDIDNGPFSLVTDPSGQAIAAGAEFTVIADYTPSDDATGHAAQVVVRSTDPDEPEVSIVLLGGNGGDDYGKPIAEIDCDALSGTSPPTTVALRAPGSDDPEDVNDAYPLLYEWELIGRPELSRTYIMNPNEEETDLFIDVAGLYEIQLIVTDFNGLVSQPDVCEVNVVPDEDLYIALSWDTNNADLDLHLVPAGSQLWGPLTCFFCCPVPVWPVTWGIPVYTLDNTVGYGPESINVAIPGENTFNIRAYYYHNGGGGPTEATVSVYIDGILAETISQTIPDDGQVWKVGAVTFDGPAHGPSREGVFILQDVVEDFPSKSCPDC